MRAQCRLIKGNKTCCVKTVEDTCTAGSDFRDRLENCILGFCREADIPAPMWLSKNTAEIARFGKTDFFCDQFAEKVPFDRFEFKIAAR